MIQRRASSYAGNVVLIIFSCFVALSAFELLIEYQTLSIPPLTEKGFIDYNQLFYNSARARNAFYDERSIAQVISERRAQGARAYPLISAAYFSRNNNHDALNIDGRSVVPLGMVPLAENYYCNESGKIVNFLSDRHGFRNDDQLWDRREIDIMTVGDSFTMGSCLDETDSIVGNLRKGGQKIINLGIGSNGPLEELAGIREYAPTIKPKIILWFFFVNDFDDLARDGNNSILRQYANPLFSQDLFSLAPRLTPLMENEANNYFKKINRASTSANNNKNQHWYTFPALRSLYLFLLNTLTHQDKIKSPDIESFVSILKLANSEAHANGSFLYFIYLPDCLDYSYGQRNWKTDLLNRINQLSIPVVDTEAGINELIASGEAITYACPGGHYNTITAQAIAQDVAQKISNK